MARRVEHITVPAPRSRQDRQQHLFDARPIEMGGFRLSAREARPVGRPSLDQAIAAVDFSTASEDASPWWSGDLWNYIKSRKDWSEKEVVQALGRIGRDLTVKTLENRGHIVARVRGRARELAPSLAHADAVCMLDPVEQVEILERADTEGLNLHQTRKVVKAKIRRRVIEGQATLQGLYRVVYVDVPWPQYRSRQPSGVRADDHYRTELSIDELCKLPVAAHMLPDAVMFFWVTAPLLYECTDGLVPDALRIIRAWDFEYKTNSVWDKVLGSFGDYFHACHEHLLVCTRGSCLPDCPVPSPDSVQTIRRSDVHSEKPEEYRKIIEGLYTTGPYLELFGRQPVDGWSVYGDDPALWVDDAERSAGDRVRPAADAVSDAAVG